MAYIVKDYVLNSFAVKKRNNRMFAMSKAGLGISLKNSEDIHPDFKFKFIEELDFVSQYEDIDCDSFDQILFEKLVSIKYSVLQDLGHNGSVGKAIDSLITRLKL